MSFFYFDHHLFIAGAPRGTACRYCGTPAPGIFMACPSCALKTDAAMEGPTDGAGAPPAEEEATAVGRIGETS